MSVKACKTLDQVRKELYAECRQLAESAFKRYGVNVCQKLYLCGHKGTESEPRSWWTAFFLESEDNTEGQVVLSEHVPRDRTLEQLVDWFHERLKREPLWICVE